MVLHWMLKNLVKKSLNSFFDSAVSINSKTIHFKTILSTFSFASTNLTELLKLCCLW